MIVTPLGLALLISLVYLLCLRLLDLNEREPLWAVALLFLLGFLAAGAVRAGVPSVELELTVARGALWETVGLGAALLFGLAVLRFHEQSSGWSELQGAMDGVIYGAAAGLGYAAGRTLATELLFGGGGASTLASGGAGLLPVLVSGFSFAVFGAVAGAALVAAFLSHTVVFRLLWLAVGIGGAWAANAGFRELAWGQALGGSGALVRTWLALGLPVVLALAVAVYAVVVERRLIVRELGPELSDPAVVGEGDLELLSRPLRRFGVYVRTMLRSGPVRASVLQQLHYRQVQLALQLRRHGGGTNPRSEEADRLRNAIRDRRERLRELDGGRAG